MLFAKLDERFRVCAGVTHFVYSMARRDCKRDGLGPALWARSKPSTSAYARQANRCFHALDKDEATSDRLNGWVAETVYKSCNVSLIYMFDGP